MFELTNRAKKKLKNLFKTTVAVTSSFSIVLSSVSYSYAQSIIVDPSAIGTSFLQTSNLTPQIDIANPQSGVSLNQFSEFNVGSEGLILNNSTTGGVSIIGANVTANANLVSGPATVIVNEVTSAAPSSLTGITEVFGQQAAVIIANPNGILCNGCSFLNTTSTSLTTGVPTISAGGDVSLTVEKGTITIGTSGFTSENNLGLYGRHVIINGEVKTLNQGAVNTAIVSGGGQNVIFGAATPDQGDVTAHITTETITSPFAIDASEAGRISSGNVTILGNEAGQGVNIYGDITTGGALSASSGGDLFYKNVTTGGDATFSAVNGGIRQYGDLNANGTVTIAGSSFTLYDGRIIQTTGDIIINTAEYLVIAGEVSGASITIDISNGTLTNTGFILSDNDLSIVAGDGVSQQRNVASEYDIYFDPALQQYLQAYQTQLLEGGAEADIAAEMIARAELHDLIAEYIDQGATMSGTNVIVTAGNDITNTGGAIAATNDILLTAGNQIINEFLALRSRLNAEDGCPDETCGYRTDFHAGEILAGNDLTLTTTTGNIENRASDIAAANNILLNAGQDVVNALMASNYDVNDTETVQLIGNALIATTTCGKDCTTSYSIVQTEYSTNEFHFDEENILSPGRIATLYGNVEITTGRDFVSIGSEISAGNDLTINATGQVIMSSFVDAEEDFISRNERYASINCTDGQDYSCTNNTGFNYVTYDDTTLATATSNLTGRTINITAGDNITLLGARFLAAVDLDLTSTNGSVLIDSTDLPDEIELGNSDGVQFIELREDVIAQIFGTSEFADEISGLGVFYTNLIADPVVAAATQGRVVNSAVETILAEVVQTWQAGYDPANPTEISASLTSLQTDDVRRTALAENLLYIIADELGDEADVLGDTAYTSLDEYRLLQTLIFNGASDDALNTAALSLVDALTSGLLTNTLALEAAAVAPATLPNLTVEYLELREGTIFDQVFAELSGAAPTESTETTITAYEALSIEDTFMQTLAVALANAVAVDLGRDPLFVADENGEYNTDNALLDIESDASLQRLVLEMSLILSPGSTAAIPTSAELTTLVTGGTSTEINILRIIDELADLSPLITNAIVKLIDARDLEAKSDAVLAQDASGLTVDVASLVDTVASSLGTQALTERQAEVEANTSQYVQFLQGNELLTAVEGLRRATSGADIKVAAHNVGVQSYVSLIDSDHLETLRADAAATIAALHNTIGTDIIAHNNTISTYNEDIRAQLKTLTDLLELSSTELTAEIQSQLDAITVAYDAQVITIEADYQLQLAANEAEYADLLTTQVWTSYETGGKNSTTQWKWVTVTNTYYVDLKNTADAQAGADRIATLNLADTQNLIDVALVQSSSTDAGINSQIATISTGFTTQLDSFAVEKAVLFASLTTQVTEAMRVAELVTQQKLLEESIRTTALAKGSVVEGERSLAVALTSQEFAELGRVQDISVNAAEVVENTFVEAGEGATLVTTALISADKATQDAFIDATAWRFATDKALVQLSTTPRTALISENNLNISAKDDVYVVGETTIAAINDLTIDAGRRIGLLGAINTNFRLAKDTRIGGHVEEQTVIESQAYFVRVCGAAGCTGENGSYTYQVRYKDVEVVKDVWVSNGIEEEYDVAYESFIEIGETLQLGTLQRDAYAVELINGVEAIEGEVKWLNYALNTTLYDLATTSLSAGGDLSLNSGGDILNFGGSLLSSENMFITAETDIRNEALRHNFTLTKEHGCVAYGCGREGHEYRSGEFLAGSGLIISAGGDIVNHGSVIGAAGSILADAQGDIVNEALTSQYLYHYVNHSSSFLQNLSIFGMKRRVEILNRAIISEAVITTEFGDITLNAANDIRSKGSSISSGGDITLAAGNDILLEAKAEELKNYIKIRKFSGLSFGQTKTYYNEFDTAFAQIEANNIYLDAGRNVTAIGALLFAASDIDVVAAENITFDAHQNLRYEYTTGWSLGISFPGSQIVDAALKGENIFDAYLATNPALGAVHRLATADNKWDILNGIITVGVHAPALGSAIRNGSIGTNSTTNISQSLAQQLNPFSDTVIFGKEVAAGSINKDKPSQTAGITFRFGVFESKRDWTESFVSQIVASNDLWLDAGKDLSLVGGTIASGNNNALLYAGENVMVAALSDTMRTSSSSWGVSVTYNGGWSFGADYNQSTGQSEMFTNAAITAGADLDIISGLNTSFMGANVKARDIYIDVGQDLIVQSRQNTSESDSFGFSFSTAGSFSLSLAMADRTYTDTPTTIVAQDRLSIYTGRNTFLLGAVLKSDVGNLSLDTGGLIYDNFQDSDQSMSLGINGSFSGGSLDSLGGGVSYSNTEGITYATIGAGDIRVRDYDNYNFDALNRDVDNVQMITSDTYFAIEIPAINLERWRQQVRDSVLLLKAVTTQVPDNIKADGRQAVDQFQDLMLHGATAQEAALLVAKPEYKRALDLRRQYEKAINNTDGLGPNPSSLLLAIAKGEKAFWDASKGTYVIESSCGSTHGPTPCQILISGNQLNQDYTADDVRDFYIAAFDALDDPQTRTDPEFIIRAHLAAACLAQVAIENIDPGVIAQARSLVGAEKFNANLKAAGVDHFRFTLTERLLLAAQNGDQVLAAEIRDEINQAIGSQSTLGQRYGSVANTGLGSLWQAANYIATELAAGRVIDAAGYLTSTSGGGTNPLGGWVQGVYSQSANFSGWEALLIVPGMMLNGAAEATWDALGIVNPTVVLDEFGREINGIFEDGSTRTFYLNSNSGEYYWFNSTTEASSKAVIDDVTILASLGVSGSIARGIRLGPKKEIFRPFKQKSVDWNVNTTTYNGSDALDIHITGNPKPFLSAEIQGRYRDGDFYIDFYGTDARGRRIGTELVSSAIESIGASNVKTVTGVFGLNNKAVYTGLVNKGLSPTVAAWQTPLGKTMKSLGFRTVEITTGFSNPKFKFGY